MDANENANVAADFGGNVIDLDCGIAAYRLRTWLDEELALPRCAAGWNYTEGASSCRVRLEPMERSSWGPVSIERTRLLAHGAPEALASFHRLFTLRFLSAGG